MLISGADVGAHVARHREDTRVINGNEGLTVLEVGMGGTEPTSGSTVDEHGVIGTWAGAPTEGNLLVDVWTMYLDEGPCLAVSVRANPGTFYL